MGRFAVESPGEQLLLRLVRSCCERGFETFDLGIGEARYKNMLCGDAEPLFDSYIALSPAGRVLAFGYGLGAATKRAIKTRPALWSFVGKLRRLRAKFSAMP
jgi:CelD/BcsL family acetyltransferase involved in cellulose biosynthesis